jgi:hypothetical protein
MDGNWRIIQKFPHCREICVATKVQRNLFGSGYAGLGVVCNPPPVLNCSVSKLETEVCKHVS